MPVATHGSVKGVTPRAARRAGRDASCSPTPTTSRSGPGVEIVAALGGAARAHGLGRADPHRQRRLPGDEPRRPGRASTTTACATARTSTGVRGAAARPRTRSPVQEALGVDVAMSLDECVPAARRRRPVARGGRADDRVGRARAGGAPASPTWRSSASCRAASTRRCARRARRRCSRSASTATRSAVCRSASRRRRRRASRRRPSRCCPPDRPRYLMGMGTPARFAYASRPWGMTSSIASCRPATRATGRSSPAQGKLMIRNARHARDPRPVDDGCACYTCRHFSRGALRHLALAREMLGAQLATLHNLHFYLAPDARDPRGPGARARSRAGAAAAAGAWA